MKKIIFIILISMMFSSNLYAKKAKSGASKSTLGSKPVATQQQKTATPNQPTPAATANTAPNQPASATNANAAPAQNPSMLQSVMPALVGGAVGSYVGSKLAADGEAEKSAEEASEKKDEHPLTAK